MKKKEQIMNLSQGPLATILTRIGKERCAGRGWRGGIAMPMLWQNRSNCRYTFQIFEPHTHLQDTHLEYSLNHFDQTLVHILPAAYHHHLMVSNAGAEQGMPQNTNLAFFLNIIQKAGAVKPMLKILQNL